MSYVHRILAVITHPNMEGGTQVGGGGTQVEGGVICTSYFGGDHTP